MIESCNFDPIDDDEWQFAPPSNKFIIEIRFANSEADFAAQTRFLWSNLISCILFQLFLSLTQTDPD